MYLNMTAKCLIIIATWAYLAIVSIKACSLAVCDESQCLFGFEDSPSGCPTCNCRSKPVQDKRRSCPSSNYLDYTIECQTYCENDIDCPGVQKCCKTGNQNMCRNPEKPGRCPLISAGLTICPVYCGSDYDCFGTDKCCSTKYHAICAKADFSNSCPNETDVSCTAEDDDECMSNDDCIDPATVCCLTACKRSKCTVAGCTVADKTEDADISGGWSDPRQADNKAQFLCKLFRSVLEDEIGKKFDVFKAVEVRTQTVRGTNYFVKVDVGGAEYLLLRIYEPLPFAAGTSSYNLVKYQYGRLRHIW